MKGLACESCAFAGREVTEGVEFESSRAMYDHQQCIHTDCLESPDLREACFLASDPNKPLALCRDSAAEHHENWNHQWADYYAGLL